MRLAVDVLEVEVPDPRRDALVERDRVDPGVRQVAAVETKADEIVRQVVQRRVHLVAEFEIPADMRVDHRHEAVVVAGDPGEVR